MAELVALGPGTYCLPGTTNLGVIAAGGRAVAVDAGLDDDRARRLLRGVREAGLEVGAIVLTHFHADHVGGVAFLASRTAAPVYCLGPERPYLENPLLSACVLFGGLPPRNLRNKFLVAPPFAVAGTLAPGPMELCGVELEVVALPGHTPGHLGLRCGQVLFSGDAYFGREVLSRHAIPFLMEVGPAIATLEGMLAREKAPLLVPGHGQPGPVWRDDAQANLDRIREVSERLWTLLERPRTSEEATREVCLGFGVALEAPSEYYLMLLVTKAFLSHLYDQGRARTLLRDGRLLWTRQ